MSASEKAFLENKIQIPRRRSVSNGSVCLEKFTRELRSYSGKEIAAKFLMRVENIKTAILSRLPNYVSETSPYIIYQLP